MKKLLVTLIIYFLLITPYTAQEDSPFVSNGYIGYSINNINFQPKGFENFDGWEGFEINLSGLNFSYHEGQVRKIGADSTVGNPKGNVFNIGYRLGPTHWTLGSNSFTSFGVKPYLQVSGSYMQANNKVVNDNVASAGIVFSPGLQLRFSHVYLSASYNAGLYVNTTFFGGNGQHNLGKGFISGTTITIGIENAFDLLFPKEFSLRGYNVSKKTYRKDNGLKYDSRSGLYREIVTTSITEFSPGERIISLVRPFWGVGPTYSFKALRKNQALTAMKGLNFGMRFWYLMLDGFYEQGEMGLKDETSFTKIVKTYPRLRNYDFTSQVNVNHYGARIGIDFGKVFAIDVGFNKSYESKLISRMKVPFVRLNGYYTMGVTEFLNQPNYTYKNGSAMLADFQSKNNITADASNNPDFLPQKTNFRGYGASLEIGAAFLNGTWYTYKDAAIANHFQFTVGANIPLGRIFHSLRLRHTL